MALLVPILVGLILGSLLSVLIARWPGWQGVALGWSECPNCGHRLSWYELIPVVSWIIQRGRCRDCRAPVSPWYPIYEIGLAFMLGVYVWRYGILGWQGIIDLAVLALLGFLFFFDIRRFALPDVFTGLLGVLGLVRIFVFEPTAFIGSVAVAAGMALFLGALYVASGGKWLGLGDVKFAAAIGLWFGFPAALLVSIIAVWVAALVGVMLIILGKATRKSPLPFGAFWTTVAALAMLWPEPIAALARILLPS